MRKAQCYGAFCAEHRGSGLNAVGLSKAFKQCTSQEAQRLKEKWSSLPPNGYLAYCEKMKGSGLAGPELAQEYSKTIRQDACVTSASKSVVLKKKPKPTYRISASMADEWRRTTSVTELKFVNSASGYRYVIVDNRDKYSHAAYSYSIDVSGRTVRSQGFATATEAADALLRQVKRWIREFDNGPRPVIAKSVVCTRRSIPGHLNPVVACVADNSQMETGCENGVEDKEHDGVEDEEDGVEDEAEVLETYFAPTDADTADAA
eukprot:3622542-Prymnesium_polylepis.1